MSQRRHLVDTYEEFAIVAMPKIRYRSREYLALWPTTTVARLNCDNYERDIVPRTSRVDGADRK